MRQVASEVEERLKGLVKSLALALLPAREEVARRCGAQRARREAMRRELKGRMEELEREHAVESARVEAEMEARFAADSAVLKALIAEEEQAGRDAMSLEEAATTGLGRGVEVVCYPLEAGGSELAAVKRMVEAGDGAGGSGGGIKGGEKKRTAVRVVEAHRIIVRSSEARFEARRQEEGGEGVCKVFVALEDEEAAGDALARLSGYGEEARGGTTLLHREMPRKEGGFAVLLGRVLLGRVLERAVGMEEAAEVLARGGVDSCPLSGGGVAVCDVSRLCVDHHARVAGGGGGVGGGWEMGDVAKLLLPGRDAGEEGQLGVIEIKMEAALEAYREGVRESLGIRPRRCDTAHMPSLLATLRTCQASSLPLHTSIPCHLHCHLLDLSAATLVLSACSAPLRDDPRCRADPSLCSSS